MTLGILAIITVILVYCMSVCGKGSVVLEAIQSRKGAKETLTSVAKELLTPAEKASTIDKAPVSDPRSPRLSVAPPPSMEIQRFDGKGVEPMAPLSHAYSPMGYLDPPTP